VLRQPRRTEGFEIRAAENRRTALAEIRSGPSFAKAIVLMTIRTSARPNLTKRPRSFQLKATKKIVYSFLGPVENERSVRDMGSRHTH
jgi:hypothetical protein